VQRTYILQWLEFTKGAHTARKLQHSKMSIAKNIICLFVICTVLCSCNVLALPLWINQDRTVLHPILVPSPSPSPSPSASPTTTTTTTSSSYGLYGSRLSLDDALVADDLLRVHMSSSPSPSMMMSSMH